VLLKGPSNGFTRAKGTSIYPSEKDELTFLGRKRSLISLPSIGSTNDSFASTDVTPSKRNRTRKISTIEPALKKRIRTKRDARLQGRTTWRRFVRDPKARLEESDEAKIFNHPMDGKDLPSSFKVQSMSSMKELAGRNDKTVISRVSLRYWWLTRNY
jgi:hypothetical protein